MAYTNIWSKAAPLGSQAANLIDDDLRALKLDISERLTTILGTPDLDAQDPVVATKLDFFNTASPKIKGGTVDLHFRNNADSADNIVITDAGLITVRGNIQQANYQLNSSANQGSLVLQATAGGAVGWTFSANTSDRLTLIRNGGSQIFSVDPSGPVTFGFNLIISTGGITVSAGGASITGDSYVNGKLRVNSTTAATYELEVNGSIRVGFTQGAIQPLLSRDGSAGGLIIDTVGGNGNTIIKSNGTVIGTFTLGVLTVTGTGTVNVSADGANLNERGFKLQTAGANRWFIYADANSESGANAGSNLAIRRYDDTNVSLGNIVTITRSTGLINLNGPVVITSNTAPTLQVSKNSSIDNIFIRLTDSEASGKSWNLVIDSVANGSRFGIYDSTDAVYGLQISPTAVVTIGAQTAYPSANFTDGSNTLELGWSGNIFFLKQTQVTDRVLSFRNHSAVDVLKVDYSANVVTANIFDATTGFRISGAAASGRFLRGDGTNFVSNTIQSGDLPTALTPTTLTVGGGSLLSKLLTGSVTVALNGGASISVGVSLQVTITVTGAAVGDAVFVNNPWAADDTRIGFTGAYVSAPNTVLATYANTGTAGTNIPTSRTAKAWVLA